MRSSARSRWVTRKGEKQTLGLRCLSPKAAKGGVKNCLPILKALADESRYQIVRELAHSPHTVGELESALHLTQYNVSKHLRILRGLGIVESERDGQFVIYSLADGLRKTPAKPSLDFGCCSFRFD